MEKLRTKIGFFIVFLGVKILPKDTQMLFMQILKGIVTGLSDVQQKIEDNKREYYRGNN